MQYGFNLVWSEDDAGFIATCPDFPGLSAFGETAEEALAEAKIALELFIESFAEAGDELPEPTQMTDYSGQVRFRMPKSLHRSLAQQSKAEGVSLNTWMVTLLSGSNSSSMLADKVCSKIERVEKAINTQNGAMESITINQKADYNFKLIEGGLHGKAKSVLN